MLEDVQLLVLKSKPCGKPHVAQRENGGKAKGGGGAHIPRDLVAISRDLGEISAILAVFSAKGDSNWAEFEHHNSILGIGRAK
jgi:hypothetical protein